MISKLDIRIFLLFFCLFFFSPFWRTFLKIQGPDHTHLDVSTK